jgi:hypothetical protein
MNRRELVRRLVLNAIADDYENVDQVILRHVAEDGAKCGLTIDRTEIVDALARLIEDGFARAYLLSSREPFRTELQGMPLIDVVEEYFETYFYITKHGTGLLLYDDASWPFDDERNLRPNWRLDPET